jgi:hypothetical protein
MVVPNEFDSVVWLKPNAHINSPHVTQLIDLSNKMTYWIITEILRPNNIQERVNTIQFFLKMGEELIRLKNFNAASVLSLSIQHPSVMRLTHTWELLQDPGSLNSLNNLKRLFLLPLQNPREGYYEYWNLQQAISPPFIPFFRIILEGIAFENTSPEEPTLTTRNYQCVVRNNNDFVGQRVDRQMVTQQYLDLIVKAKEGSYPLPKERFLEEHLDERVMTVDEIYERSKNIQPRNPPPPPHQEEEPGINYIPYLVVGIGVIIGIGAWFYKRK